MTEQLLPFDAPSQRKRKPTLTDRLDAYFAERVGQWISVATMADVVGHSGVRQRRLECEKRGWKLAREYHGTALGFTVVAGPKEHAA